MRMPEETLIGFARKYPKPRLEDKAETWAQRAQSAFFTVVFSFFTTPAGKFLLMGKGLILHLPLQVFLFPIAAVLEVTEAAAALKLLYSSKNRNLGKTLDAFKKSQKAGIIVPAIALGLTATITGIPTLGMFVPYLFLTAIGSYTLYTIVQFAYSTYKYSTIKEKGSALREGYKQRMIEMGVRSVVGIVLTATIVCRCAELTFRSWGFRRCWYWFYCWCCCLWCC